MRPSNKKSRRAETKHCGPKTNINPIHTSPISIVQYPILKRRIDLNVPFCARVDAPKLRNHPAPIARPHSHTPSKRTAQAAQPKQQNDTLAMYGLNAPVSAPTLRNHRTTTPKQQHGTQHSLANKPPSTKTTGRVLLAHRLVDFRAAGALAIGARGRGGRRSPAAALGAKE